MLIGWHVYQGGQEVRTGDSLEEALALPDRGDFTWFRIDDPDPGEIAALAEAFDLPELAVEDATGAHQRPKLERYGDVAFLVMKPAFYDDAAETVSLGEVHVFVGPGFAISIRHGRIGVLDPVCRRLHDAPELAAEGSAAVLHAVADHIVDAYLPVVRGLERDIEEIERAVFDQEVPPTERIYALMREVLDFQRATASLLRPMDDLSQGHVPGVGEVLAPHFRDVADHARMVHERTTGFRDLLNNALQANLALVGLRDTMEQRKISAWAAIALVPTIIGGLWGMNVPELPLDDQRWGFAVLVAVMLTASGYLWWRFHRNDWL